MQGQQVKECTPVFAPIPHALSRAYINVRDAPRGTLFVWIGKSIGDHHQLVVGPNGRVFIPNNNDARQTTFPLRSAIDRSKSRGMYGLRRVVGTGREALQDWVLLIGRPEYGSEEV